MNKRENTYYIETINSTRGKAPLFPLCCILTERFLVFQLFNEFFV